jgi:hypothetical protein
VTGFIVDSVDDAIDAVCRVESIDRRACRKTFEKRFAVRRMASDYVEVYQKLVGTRSGMVA